MKAEKKEIVGVLRTAAHCEYQHTNTTVLPKVVENTSMQLWNCFSILWDLI